MPTLSDPKKLKTARVYMWVDQIIKNIESIENDFNSEDYEKARQGLGEQYRLISILRRTKEGKTVLRGWKTKSDLKGE